MDISATYVNVSETVTNIAKDRPANQSSIIGKANASFAVDGNVDGLGLYGECSITSESLNPWWKVDLGNIYRVDDVVVVIGGTHNGGLWGMFHIRCLHNCYFNCSSVV